MTAGKSLPWLQDVDADANQSSDVWYDSWNVTYRDVFILDGSNSFVEAFNLTEHNLANAEDYEALRTKLIDAAMTVQKPWHNAANPYDVNDDGFVVPLDVLFQINSINDEGPRQLAAPTGAEMPAYYDTSGDGWLSSIDALQVINYMDEVRAAGEGPPVEENDVAPLALPQPSSETVARSNGEPVQSLPTLIQSSADSESAVVGQPVAGTASSVTNEISLDSPEDEFWASYWNAPVGLLPFDV
jgi:hypothetical protein